MALSWTAVGLVCFFVFLAGFVDSAAGGGLISLPAYLFVGLPGHYALGCNKFSASCGSALRFLKNGVLEWTIALISAFVAAFASFAGTKITLFVNQEIVKIAVVVVLPVMAVVILVKKNIGSDNRSQELSRKKAYMFAALIGFYWVL